MGAFAHMVAFDGELKGFAHLHPEENLLPVGEGDLHEGPLSFTFTRPNKGFTVCGLKSDSPANPKPSSLST